MRCIALLTFAVVSCSAAGLFYYNTASNSDTIPSVTIVRHIDSPSERSLSELSHYRDVLSYLTFINSASEQQLQSLLQQFTALDHHPPAIKLIKTAVHQRWSEINPNTPLNHSTPDIVKELTQNAPCKDNFPDSTPDASVSVVADPHSFTGLVVNGSHCKTPADVDDVDAILAATYPEQFARQIMAEREQNSDAVRPHPDLLEIALIQWAEQDPQAAFEFVSGETDETTRSSFSPELLRIWYGRDPQAAIVEVQTALQNQAEKPRQQVLLTELYAAHLASIDPLAAYEWVTAQSGVATDNAKRRVVYRWGEKDSPGLERFLEQLDSSEKEQLMPVALATIASSKTREDPAGAMAWAEQLPAAHRHKARMHITTEWVYAEPESAIEWLLNLPVTSNNRELIHSAINSVSYSHPANALHIVSTMPAQWQLAALETLVTLLDQQHPDYVRQWLAQYTEFDFQQLVLAILDVMNPEFDTRRSLERLAAIESDGREYWLYNAIRMRLTMDQAAVEEWLVSTRMVNHEEYNRIQQILSAFHQTGIDSRVTLGY